MLINDILRSQLSQWKFVCRECGETKQKSGPNQNCCAECRALRDKKYHRARHKRNIGDAGECAKCAAPFPLTHSTRTLCDACQYRPGPQPQCVHCGRDFQRVSNRQKYCSDCKPVRIKKMKVAEFQRAWKKSEFRACRLAKAIKYQNKKYRTDPVFNIHRRMRTGINASLRGKKNGFSWEKLVGYTVEDLMVHLERLFLPGMTWDNRGTWHIDHVKPLAAHSFETVDDPEFKAAWALTNLQPLWALDNIKKGAKIA